MGNLNTALERALPIIAAAYGQQFGVNVVLSGSTACTNGKTIVLPLLDQKRELKDVLLGYLAHEASHIRDSDFSLIGLCKSPLEKSFLNLIEDIRIEQLIQVEFPGTQFTLCAMEEFIHQQGWTPVPTLEENEAQQLQGYLYHRLYGEVLKRECYQDLTQVSFDVVKQTFPEGFFIKLDGIFAKHMHSLKDSHHCLLVARSILKALKDAEQDERDKEQQQQDENQQQANDGSQDQSEQANDDQQAGSNDQSDSSSTPEQSQDNGEGKDESDSDSSGDNNDQTSLSNEQSDDKGEQSNQDGSSNSSGQEESPTQYERIINETDVREDTTDKLKGELQHKAVEDNGHQQLQISTSDVGPMVGSDGDVKSLRSGILSSSVIRNKLLGLLQAQTREKTWLHNNGKRVGNRIARIATGDSKVFIQRETQKRTDTAVHVLLDTSGSMHRDQDVANQATVSLALAVQSIPKSDIAVSMFPGMNGASISPMLNRGQPVRANLGRFAIESSGGTPLAEAMLFAARELVQSKRERKVLIVITDGEPNCGSSVNYMNSLMKDHVDIYAIGINSTAVKSYFKNWSVIRNVSELQQALFSVAGQFLNLA